MPKTSWIISKARDWVNYVPCARPSNSEMTEIEKIMLRMGVGRKQKPLRVVIFGCTIEYRGICHKYGCDVTLIEFSKEHYKIVSQQQTSYKGKEKLRFEDWRKIKTHDKYDIILGDNTMNMLTSKDREIVLEKIAESLAPNGIFITRSYIRPKKLRKNLEEVLKIRNVRWPTVQIYTAAILDIFPLYTDPETEFVNMKKLLVDLKKATNKGLLSRAEYFWLRERFTKDKCAVTLPTIEFLENQMRKHFELKKRYGIDVYAALQPIHILKRK